MSHANWLLYGANGYTGELIAREAVAQGLRPALAGRNGEAVAKLASELSLPALRLSLDDPTELAAALLRFRLVLHAAGPFSQTSKPMVEACLATRVHYLDITGEIGVFERIARQDDRARQAGVVLLPGVGFDVVPTDCLAAALAHALPEADRLELAFCSAGGSWSRGTAKTMVEGLPLGAAERRQGKIVPLPVAAEMREIPFGCGPRWAMPLGWGDVSTAFRTTGIPNIRVWIATPRAQIRRLQRLRWLLPLAALAPIRRLLHRRIERTVTGPSAAVRERARMHLWGQATAPDGRRAEAVLETPEGYALTASAAVAAARRVLAGEVKPGTWTPAAAFGAGFVHTLPGVAPLVWREPPGFRG
jgi:short subunit dehydrogenase-like uncharacterized protein